VARHEVCKRCELYKSLSAPFYRRTEDDRPHFWYCVGADVVQIESDAVPRIFRGTRRERECPYKLEMIVAGRPPDAKA
jgi:hypothetical protein